MLVYNDNKRQFITDVNLNRIAAKILRTVQAKGLYAGNEREYVSWNNSMKFMRDIVNDSDIDDNRICIELLLSSKSSKRLL